MEESEEIELYKNIELPDSSGKKAIVKKYPGSEYFLTIPQFLPYLYRGGAKPEPFEYLRRTTMPLVGK